MKLHIGGVQPHPDWKILNIQPGPHVDFVGTCTDLSRFVDDSIEAIYCAHTFEHLGYADELPRALAECRRVLVPGGELMISVPDLKTLCEFFVADGLSTEQKFWIMRLMFGGQRDEHDFHKVGLTEEFLIDYLAQAGFSSCRRIDAPFDLFDDGSKSRLGLHLTSLNMIATK